MRRYSLPIQASSFGVGVEAAIKEATVTMIVTHVIKLTIISIFFSLYGYYELADMYALPVVIAVLQSFFLLEDDPFTLGVSSSESTGS